FYTSTNSFIQSGGFTVSATASTAISVSAGGVDWVANFAESASFEGPSNTVVGFAGNGGLGAWVTIHTPTSLLLELSKPTGGNYPDTVSASIFGCDFRPCNAIATNESVYALVPAGSTFSVSFDMGDGFPYTGCQTTPKEASSSATCNGHAR